MGPLVEETVFVFPRTFFSVFVDDLVSKFVWVRLSALVGKLAGAGARVGFGDTTVVAAGVAGFTAGLVVGVPTGFIAGPAGAGAGAWGATVAEGFGVFRSVKICTCLT